MQRGFTLLETLVALLLVGMALAVALPAAAHLWGAGRTAAAARQMATDLQAMRWRSVAGRRAHGLLFERDGRGWFWRAAQDGNGNGMRTRDVRGGADPVLSGPHRIENRLEHVRLGFPPGGPFPRIPPERGLLDARDPIQFGRSDLVAFSHLGSGSSGTLYLTNGRDELFGVVLFGPTCRVRVWRYDVRARRWTL